MKKWGSVLLGLATVLVAVAELMTATGFRFDRWLPDPVAGFTAHQWGILLSGFIGSGASVLIAYFALSRTIRTMREQTSAEAREAAKQREIEVRSELLHLLADYSSIAFRPEGADKERLVAMERMITIALQKWRINLSSKGDHCLRTELYEWRRLLPSMRELAGGHSPSYEDGHFLLDMCIEALENVAGNYREMSHNVVWTDEYSANVLTEAREPARELIAEVEAETWGTPGWLSEAGQ